METKKGPMGGGPGAAMQGGTEKAKDFKGTMGQLLSYLKKFRIAIIFVLVLAVGSTIFSIVGPKILGNATTELFEGLVRKIAGTGGIDFNIINKTLLLLLGFYLISLIFSFLQGLLMSSVTQKITYQLRKQISEKINRLPMRYFDKNTHGEILSRVSNDVDTLSQNLNQSMTQVITSITMLLGVFVMMLSISVIMTLVIMVILPISMGLISLIIKKSQRYFKEQQEYLGHVNGQVEEVYGGHNIVKAFNGEKAAVKTFDHYNDTLYTSAWKSQFLSGMMMPIMQFIGNVGYVIVSIFGGWLVIKNRIQVGDILSFTQYVRQFTQPLAQVAQVANLMQSTAAASERVFEFLNEDEEAHDIRNAVSANNLIGEVAFEHVKFGYDADKVIIKDFNSKVKKGQKVAIVGPTGAGKTTLVKLLMRFYDVNNGEIMVDGHNIKNFKRNDLRNLFGMVLQETWLFNGTIRDNIRYGKLNATDEEVEEAAKAVHIDHFIKTLPESYDSLLNEEANNISQGQRQLLTIARVILADPKILILDEATSSVDTRTEELIQKAMDQLMEGRTSFVIAHRLSTIKNADIILVMNEGDIVEQGNHEALLKKNGFYAKLYNSQFEEVEA